MLALTRTHIHAFTQRRPKARRQTENEDWSARLVPNSSQFRSPICHPVDLASTGMHLKFGKLRILPGNLKTMPKWNPCLVRGKVFLGVKLARTVLRSESLSRRARLCRHEQRNVDKSHAVWTEAILDAVSAVLCRQEQCRQEQDVVAMSRVLSTRTFWETVLTAEAAWGACLGGLGACLDGLEPV